jgi:hypothetical protein
VLGFLGFSMLDHPANTDRVALAFWIVAGFAVAVGDPPGRGLVARLRRRPPEEPETASIRGGEHAPSLAERPRTGNVRPMPRGPDA